MDKVRYLRFCVQRVLPLVYDDSLSYYELLNKVVHKLNETITITNENLETIRNVVIEWLEENSPETILGLDALKTYETPLDYKAAISSTDDDMIESLINSTEAAGTQAVIPKGEYHLTKGYATDEKYLVSNQGTFPENGISISKRLDFNTYYKKIAEVLYSDMNLGSSYYAQGACYCAERNSIFAAFFTAQTPTGTQIFEFNRNLEIINHAFVNVYHGAGLIYDDLSHQLVAVGGNEDPSHFVYFIDPSTLRITESKNIGATEALHGISRDSNGNWFVVVGHNALKIYDKEWNTIKTISDPFTSIIYGSGETAGLEGSTLFQTISPAYEGQVFVLYNIRGRVNEYLGNVIAQVNYTDSKLKSFHIVPPTDPRYEGESIFFIFDKMYIFETNQATQRCALVECAEMTSFSVLDLRNFAAFGGRIGIPNGADLNDYVYPGFYYTGDSAATNTLLNLPQYASTFTGMTLLVEMQGNVNIRQTIKFQPSNMYRLPEFVRYYDIGTGTFTAWAAMPIIPPEAGPIFSNVHKLLAPGHSQTFTLDVGGWFGDTGNFYFTIPCVYTGTPAFSNVSLVNVACDAAGEVNITNGGYEDLRIAESGDMPYIRALLYHVTNESFRSCVGKLTLQCAITFS